mgnify:CR=1 FL=1
MVKVTEMFFRIFFFCSMLVFCSFPALAGEAEARVVLNMNTGWAFHRGEVESGGQPGLDDSGWIAAIIPHIMQLEKKIYRYFMTSMKNWQKSFTKGEKLETHLISSILT